MHFKIWFSSKKQLYVEQKVTLYRAKNKVLKFNY